MYLHSRFIHGFTEQFDDGPRNIGAAIGENCVFNLQNELDQCGRCETYFHLEKITNSEKLSMNGSENYVQAGLSEHFDLKHPCSVFTDSISDESKCHDSLLNCEKINLNSYPNFKTCVEKSCETNFNTSCELSEPNCCGQLIEEHESFYEATNSYPIQYSYTRYYCEPNECTCADGMPVNSADCEIQGEEKCETCDPGYFRDYDFVCRLNKCDCENGEANVGMSCEKNGVTSCKKFSCDIGYHHDNAENTCVSNECECLGGKGFKNTYCGEHGSEFCKPTSCLEGYFLDINEFDIEFESPGLDELKIKSLSSNMSVSNYAQQNTFETNKLPNFHFSWSNITNPDLKWTEISTVECKKRTCTCENGNAEDGSYKCNVHNKTICSTECHTGYHFNGVTIACDENVCKCQHGTGSRANLCSKQDAFGCQSCDSGYHINDTTKNTVSQSCVLNTCRCEGSALSGTEGIACQINNATSCQPENYVKEFCFQRCLENYSENRTEIIRISLQYLLDCENPESLEKTKNCMEKVQTVCNIRCFHYGQTELKVNNIETRRSLWTDSNGL